MTPDAPRASRRSIRLAGFDYRSPRCYFVTICIHQRQPILGKIRDGVMHLSALGRLASEEWQRSSVIRKEIALDAFVVMPNHVHGLVAIVQTDDDVVGAQGLAPLHESAPLQRPPRSLGSFVSGFKRAVVHRAYREGLLIAGTRLWQRNYYESIIRDENGLARAREYILNNVPGWDQDQDNPDHMASPGFMS